MWAWLHPCLPEGNLLPPVLLEYEVSLSNLQPTTPVPVRGLGFARTLHLAPTCRTQSPRVDVRPRWVAWVSLPSTPSWSLTWFCWSANSVQARPRSRPGAMPWDTTSSAFPPTSRKHASLIGPPHPAWSKRCGGPWSMPATGQTWLVRGAPWLCTHSPSVHVSCTSRPSLPSGRRERRWQSRCKGQCLARWFFCATRSTALWTVLLLPPATHPSSGCNSGTSAPSCLPLPQRSPRRPLDPTRWSSWVSCRCWQSAEGLSAGACCCRWRGSCLPICPSRHLTKCAGYASWGHRWARHVMPAQLKVGSRRQGELAPMPPQWPGGEELQATSGRRQGRPPALWSRSTRDPGAHSELWCPTRCAAPCPLVASDTSWTPTRQQNKRKYIAPLQGLLEPKWHPAVALFVTLKMCHFHSQQHATAGIHSAHWGIMITHHSNYRKSRGGNSENMWKLKYEASPSMATTACPLERAGPQSVPWCVRPPAASRRFGYYGHLPCCIMMNHAASCCSAYVPLIAWDPTSSVEKDSKALRGINICARFSVQSTPWTVCVCVWE